VTVQRSPLTHRTKAHKTPANKNNARPSQDRRAFCFRVKLFALSEYPPEYRIRTVGVVEHSPEAKERAYQLWKEKNDATEIALELAIPASTIRSWKDRYNWPDRLAIEQTPGVAINAETAATLARHTPARAASSEFDKLDLAEKQERYTDAMGSAALRVAEYVASLPGADIVKQADKLKKADEFNRKALKLETEKPSTVINVALLSHSTEKQPRLVSDSSSLRELDDAPPSQN